MQRRWRGRISRIAANRIARLHVHVYAQRFTCSPSGPADTDAQPNEYSEAPESNSRHCEQFTASGRTSYPSACGLDQLLTGTALKETPGEDPDYVVLVRGYVCPGVVVPAQIGSIQSDGGGLQRKERWQAGGNRSLRKSARGCMRGVAGTGRMSQRPGGRITSIRAR
jgi:hypothetical protein